MYQTVLYIYFFHGRTSLSLNIEGCLHRGSKVEFTEFDIVVMVLMSKLHKLEISSITFRVAVIL